MAWIGAEGLAENTTDHPGDIHSMECITPRPGSQDERNYDGDYEMPGSGHMYIHAEVGQVCDVNRWITLSLLLLHRDQWVKPSQPMRSTKDVG